MKTLSLFLCLFLVVLGFINALFLSRFVEGSIIMNIGGLSLLIISSKTKKIEGYDRKHWMNK